MFCKQIFRDNSGYEHHKKLVKAERDDGYYCQKLKRKGDLNIVLCNYVLLILFQNTYIFLFCNLTFLSRFMRKLLTFLPSLHCQRKNTPTFCKYFTVTLTWHLLAIRQACHPRTFILKKCQTGSCTLFYTNLNLFSKIIYLGKPIFIVHLNYLLIWGWKLALSLCLFIC